MAQNHLFNRENQRRKALATSQVVPHPRRCVQCGICSYNCPMGIDVRQQVWLGEPVNHSYCISCGECVARCPRGVLFFQETHLFKKEELE